MLIKKDSNLHPTRAIELFHMWALIVFFSIEKSNDMENPKLPDTGRKPLPRVLDFSFQEGPYR